MHTFSVDENLVEFLEKITKKYNFKDIEETLNKSFSLLHLVDLIDEEEGELLIKSKDGSLIKFSLHAQEKLEDNK
jgi:hypothetical protein